MELTDIMTLAKAGFTAQQIAAFGALSQAQVQVQPQAQVQVQPQAQVQVQPQAQVQVQPQAQVQVQPQSADINTMLEDMMQRSLARFVSQPPQKTTDDILAEIINPPAKED